MELVNGLTALVTGVAAGIWRATAVAFAADGTNVIVAGNDRKRCNEAIGGTAILMIGAVIAGDVGYVVQ